MLQTVAWTGMLVGNLTTDSVATAVGKTFDGKHPCCLCKAIAAGKKTEKKSEIPLQKQKFEYPPLAAVFVMVFPVRFLRLAVAGVFAEPRMFRPPTPPPRSVVG
jgi:hypothetical protein